jgi:hypothetical protein
MAITTVELYWLRMLFKDLGVPLPHAPILWCDNVSALALASNPVYHGRTKHIEIDYHFVREKVINGDTSVKYISTLDQVVDIFTKGLSSTRFSLLKSKLLVAPSPLSLRGTVSEPPVEKNSTSPSDSKDSTSASHLSSSTSPSYISNKPVEENSRFEEG